MSQTATTEIPNEFTACEVYCGHVIALRHSGTMWYSIWTEAGARLTGNFLTRDAARRGIDEALALPAKQEA